MFDDMANRSHDWLDDWKHKAAKRLEESQMMAEKLEKIKVTASDDDRNATVTVDSQGALIELKLRDTIRSQPADTTAEQIMTALRRARNGVGKGASQVVKDTIGLESETGKAIMAGYRKRLRRNEDTPGNDAKRERA